MEVSCLLRARTHGWPGRPLRGPMPYASKLLYIATLSWCVTRYDARRTTCHPRAWPSDPRACSCCLSEAGAGCTSRLRATRQASLANAGGLSGVWTHGRPAEDAASHPLAPHPGFLTHTAPAARALCAGRKQPGVHVETWEGKECSPPSCAGFCAWWSPRAAIWKHGMQGTARRIAP